jgi:hypothetical protein
VNGKLALAPWKKRSSGPRNEPRNGGESLTLILDNRVYDLSFLWKQESKNFNGIKKILKKPIFCAHFRRTITL